MNSKTFLMLLVAIGAAGLYVTLGRKPQPTPISPVGALLTPNEPKLPAPRIERKVANDSEPLAQDSPIKRMLKGEEPLEIKAPQLENYLATNHRNVGSLLAGFRLTRDRELLREAAERFPNDPRVAWESWFRTQDSAERQKWFETWEHSQPNNSLPSYLAAAELFKSGDADGAIKMLETAAAKGDFSYFARESITDCEEAYRAVGYSEAEAKMAATMGLLLPHLSELKRMSQGMADLAVAYRQAGDGGSAQAVANLGFQLAQRLTTDRSWVIEDQVALSIEGNLLKSLDPSGPSGIPGKNVQGLQEELGSRQDLLAAGLKEAEALMQQLDEQDLAAYCDRLKLFGETRANSWLQEKFGAAPQPQPP